MRGSMHKEGGEPGISRNLGRQDVSREAEVETLISVHRDAFAHFTQLPVGSEARLDLLTSLVDARIQEMRSAEGPDDLLHLRADILLHLASRWMHAVQSENLSTLPQFAVSAADELRAKRFPMHATAIELTPLYRSMLDSPPLSPHDQVLVAFVQSARKLTGIPAFFAASMISSAVSRGAVRCKENGDVSNADELNTIVMTEGFSPERWTPLGPASQFLSEPIKAICVRALKSYASVIRNAPSTGREKHRLGQFAELIDRSRVPESALEISDRIAASIVLLRSLTAGAPVSIPTTLDELTLGYSGTILSREMLLKSVAAVAETGRDLRCKEKSFPLCLERIEHLAAFAENALRAGHARGIPAAIFEMFAPVFVDAFQYAHSQHHSIVRQVSLLTALGRTAEAAIGDASTTSAPADRKTSASIVTAFRNILWRIDSVHANALKPYFAAVKAAASTAIREDPQSDGSHHAVDMVLELHARAASFELAEDRATSESPELLWREAECFLREHNLPLARLRAKESRVYHSRGDRTAAIRAGLSAFEGYAAAARARSGEWEGIRYAHRAHDTAVLLGEIINTIYPSLGALLLYKAIGLCVEVADKTPSPITFREFRDKAGQLAGILSSEFSQELERGNAFVKKLIARTSFLRKA